MFGIELKTPFPPVRAVLTESPEPEVVWEWEGANSINFGRNGALSAASVKNFGGEEAWRKVFPAVSGWIRA